MRVISKVDPDSQYTIADIAIDTCIVHEFEAQWSDGCSG
jgi:hypothetical protein